MSIFHELEKEFQMALSFLKWVLFVMQYMHGHWAFGKSRYFPVTARGLICNFPSLLKVQKPSSCFIGQETHKKYRAKCNSSFSSRFDQYWMFYCHPQDFGGGGGGGSQVLCCGYQLNIVSVWTTWRLLKVVLWNHQGPLRKEN